VRYETIDHTGDAGIIAYGTSMNELFENAAYGMFDLMFDLSLTRPDRARHIEIQGSDREEVLYGWLSETLYRFETEDTVWCSFEVRVGTGGLVAVVGGTNPPALRGSPVKAVTRHDLTIAQQGKNWTATVLFDT